MQADELHLPLNLSAERPLPPMELAAPLLAVGWKPTLLKGAYDAKYCSTATSFHSPFESRNFAVYQLPACGPELTE